MRAYGAVRGISDKVTSAASTECLLPLPATEESGERGSPVNTARKRSQPFHGAPLPGPLPASQGEGIRGAVQSILRSPPYSTTKARRTRAPVAELERSANPQPGKAALRSARFPASGSGGFPA